MISPLAQFSDCGVYFSNFQTEVEFQVWSLMPLAAPAPFCDAAMLN